MAQRQRREVRGMSDGNSNGDMDLAPQGSAAEQPDLDLAALDARELAADGLVDVDSLDYLHRRIYDTQEIVLDAYVERGTLLKATQAAGRHRDCVYRWRQQNTLCWNERWERAVQRRRDYAEDKYILHRLDNPKGNYGTDVAAIAYMNRLDPENWTRGVKVTHEVPNELIAQLQRLQALEPAPPAPKKLGPGVVDVDAEVMPWE